METLHEDGAEFGQPYQMIARDRYLPDSDEFAPATVLAISWADHSQGSELIAQIPAGEFRFGRIGATIDLANRAQSRTLWLQFEARSEAEAFLLEMPPSDGNFSVGRFDREKVR